MSQIEYASVKAPAAASQSRSRPIEDFREEVSSVSEQIASGQALLKVVAYPWGVEFDVFEAEGKR
jgi:hypothetical protein